MWANRSGRSPIMNDVSELLRLLTKNEQIARFLSKWLICSLFTHFFGKRNVRFTRRQISIPGDSFETFCIFCMFLTVFFLILCPRANCPLHSLFNCSFFKRNLSDLLMSLFRSLMSKEQLWVIASCCLWQKSNGSDLLFSWANHSFTLKN